MGWTRWAGPPLAGTSAGVSAGAYMGGVLVSSQTVNSSSASASTPTTNVTNTYVWRDGAQISQSTYLSDSTEVVHHDAHYDYWSNSYLPAYDETLGSADAWTSDYEYDAQGHLQQVVINDGQPRTVSYVTNLMGEVMKRDVSFTSGTTAAPHELHYYLAGMAIGDVTNNGTSNTDYVTQIAARTASQGYGPFRGGAAQGTSYANFDQSYDPINGFDSQTTASSYVIKPGDTLQSIARQLWGDANLWYLIGNANGLTADAHLAVGMSIVIPNNQVHNFHNSSSTFRVYDPNLGVGDVSPTAPEIPAPPPPPVAVSSAHHGGGCGIFGQIITAVLAIVVAVALPEVFPATFGGFWGGVGAAVAGDVAGQGVGLATGVQNSFNWGSVAMAAVTAGVAQGVGSSGANLFGGLSKSIGQTGVAVLQGATANAISQGIGVAAGLQKSFDWAGVAASGVGAGVAQSVGLDLWEKGYSAVTLNAVSGFAGGIASAATRSLVNGSDFGDNIISMLPNTVGQTVGNLVASRVAGWLDGGAGMGSAAGTAASAQPDPLQERQAHHQEAWDSFAAYAQSQTDNQGPIDLSGIAANFPSLGNVMLGGLDAASALPLAVIPTPETINVTARALSSSQKANFDITHQGWWNHLYSDEVQLAARAGISQRARALVAQDVVRGAAPHAITDYISKAGKSVTLEGVSKALDATGHFAEGGYLFAGGVVAAFGNKVDAVAAIEGLDKFAFGPIGNTLVAADQVVQTADALKRGSDPGAAIAGGAFNTGVIVHGSSFAAGLGTIGFDALMGVEGGPVGVIFGTGVGMATAFGLSKVLPTPSQWSQSKVLGSFMKSIDSNTAPTAYPNPY